MSEESSPSPPSLSLTTPGSEKGYPFPDVSPSPMDPKSPASAESGRPRDVKAAKKRSGKRILLFVAILPAVLVLSASLRRFFPYLMPCSTTHGHQTEVQLNKREPQLLTETSLSASSASNLASSSTSAIPSVTTSTTDSNIPTIPTVPLLPTPFPQPFETLSANFSTTGCQAFFENFTLSENFRQCRSLSFLLNASSGFLIAQRNLTLINNIMYGTCNTRPTLATCDATMSSYLTQLNSICATDLANENPVALQAQIGFQSYTAMRTAGCLENAISGRYCYVEALAASTPQDVYFWALPLGTGIPTGVKPTCGACVQSVLAVYSQYVSSSTSGVTAIPSGGSSTGNSTAASVTPSVLPVLSKTYAAAARLAVTTCGGTFASVGLASAAVLQNSVGLAMLPIGLFFASWISL